MNGRYHDDIHFKSKYAELRLNIKTGSEILNINYNILHVFIQCVYPAVKSLKTTDIV